MSSSDSEIESILKDKGTNYKLQTKGYLYEPKRKNIHESSSDSDSDSTDPEGSASEVMQPECLCTRCSWVNKSTRERQCCHKILKLQSRLVQAGKV